MAAGNVSLTDRIVIDPREMGGKPLVRDTGILVEQVLSELARVLEPQRVLYKYPQLTSQDIQASIEFARAVVESTTQHLIENLGWSRSEAAETRQRLIAFAEDWEDPSMDVYDALRSR